MTTRTLPAQASVSSPSGWTVTVTHAYTQHAGQPTQYHTWHYLVTDAHGNTRLESSAPWMATTTTGEADPMAALEWFGSLVTGGWFRSSYEFPQQQQRALADAIAGMYGEAVPCEGCLAEAGEPCRPGCLSAVTDSTGQPVGE